MGSSEESLGNLLKLITNTHDKYKKYLTQKENNNNNTNNDAISTKDKMIKAVLKCEQEFQKIVSSNIKTILQNYNSISLRYKKNEARKTIHNGLVTIENVKHSNGLLEKIANIKFSHKEDDLSYSICQFDLKYTKLKEEIIIDCDNKHIKIESMSDFCYGMILPDTQHVQGYSSGQHCFRMYYKNPWGSNRWLFFGIYKCGVMPKDVYTYGHETSWGIADGGKGLIYCNGKYECDESNMSFLYSSSENQVDMFVDFDKGILSYSIVDDKEKENIYTVKKLFDTSIAHTVHLNFYWLGTQAQIAKINVDMFGKNKKLVHWPISY